MRRHRPNGLQRDQVWVDGRAYAMHETLSVRGRSYFLLDRLSTCFREKYLAFDPGGGPHGRPVALLVLPRSPAAWQQVGVLAGLDAARRGLPQILDWDQQRDPIVVVLKWVSGITLTRFLEEVSEGSRAAMSPPIALHRVRALAHDLVGWHRQPRIVHGDIKPDNVIVTGDRGQLVLIDFGNAWGAARAADRGAGDGLSRQYAAPELQVGTSPVDDRCDQFSLSVILYQLLAGRLPAGELVPSPSGTEVLRILTTPVTPPSQFSSYRGAVPPRVWDQLDRVVLRGLASSPDDRSPTPRAWLDALDAVHRELQSPSPPSRSRNFGPLTRVSAWLTGRFPAG